MPDHFEVDHLMRFRFDWQIPDPDPSEHARRVQDSVSREQGRSVDAVTADGQLRISTRVDVGSIETEGRGSDVSDRAFGSGTANRGFF